MERVAIPITILVGESTARRRWLPVRMCFKEVTVTGGQSGLSWERRELIPERMPGDMSGEVINLKLVMVFGFQIIKSLSIH